MSRTGDFRWPPTLGPHGYDVRTMNDAAHPSERPPTPMPHADAEPVVAPVWTVRSQPQGIEWASPTGVDLVSGAQMAGWRLTRSCRNGTCRACRCRLLVGEIRHLVEWPGLSREELQDGWILPCVAVPCSPLVIEANVTPLASARER